MITTPIQPTADYIVTMENLSTNTMTFSNRFDAFNFIQQLWELNPGLHIQMITVITGWVHDLSWLKKKIA